MDINGFEVEIENQYNIKEWVKYSTCPKCSHNRKKKTDPCMSISWSDGLGQCWHCGETVQLHTFKKRKTKNDIIEYKLPKIKQIEGSDVAEENLYKFFENRGINRDIIHRYRKHVSLSRAYFRKIKKETNAIAFNHLREGKNIHINYRGRNKMFSASKDTELIFWNLDSIKYSKEVIITEGHPDALCYLQAGFIPVVSLPNGSVKGGRIVALDNCIEYFANKERIYLAIEDDEAGKATKDEFIRRLGSYRCYKVDYEESKDGNQYLLDKGEDALRKTIAEAELYPIKNVITYNDIKESLYSFYFDDNKEKRIVTGIMPEFDEKFSINMKQFTPITGKPGSGKSEVVDSLCVGYALTHNFPVCYYSKENRPFSHHLDKLMRKVSGLNPQVRSDIEGREWKLSEDFINRNFYFINDDDPDDPMQNDLEVVLSRFAELVVQKGVRIFVLDPFNKIPLRRAAKLSSQQYTTEYLLCIDAFVIKYDCHVIIVAHPVKPNKEDELTFKPTMYNIKGGTEWFDMAHNGLAVYRDHETDDVELKILKLKFQHQGEVGKTIDYKFNSVNNRHQKDFTYECLINGEIQELNIPQTNNLNEVDVEFDYSETTNFSD